VQLQVKPENTTLARYELRAKPGPGIDPSWYVLPAAQVIKSGDVYTFDLVVSAPSTGTTGGQTHEIAIEIVSDRPGIRGVIQVLKLRVMPLTRFSVALHPNEVSHNRRRHTNLTITNSGNFTETFWIEFEAPDTLRVAPDTNQIKVNPAQEQTVRLKFSPARGASKERSRLLYTANVRSSSGIIERSHGSYIFQRRGFSPVGLLVMWAVLLIIAGRQFIFGISLNEQFNEIVSLIKLLLQSITG
jgi:hypothetical protein